MLARQTCARYSSAEMLCGVGPRMRIGRPSGQSSPSPRLQRGLPPSWTIGLDSPQWDARSLSSGHARESAIARKFILTDRLAAGPWETLFGIGPSLSHKKGEDSFTPDLGRGERGK